MLGEKGISLGEDVRIDDSQDGKISLSQSRMLPTPMIQGGVNLVAGDREVVGVQPGRDSKGVPGILILDPVCPFMKIFIAILREHAIHVGITMETKNR